MIDLYTAPTPNGYKVSILLEELKLPYNVVSIELKKKNKKRLSFSSSTQTAEFLPLLITKTMILPFLSPEQF